MTNSDLEFHAFCLADTGTRLDQYAAAISARVKPGDTVIDLGAGSGILSLLACRAGARRVYAIESGESLGLARLLAARHGCADRIELIGKRSTQVVLPERVQVIVGDIHDTFGLQAHGLAATIDARDRLLAQEGALMPCSIELIAVPIEAPDRYQRAVDVWHRTIHGVDLSPIRSLAVNQPVPARVDASQLLAEPVSLTTIDLRRLAQPHAGGASETAVTRDGTLHGVCGCFISTLNASIVIGNVPGESRTTNFAQAFFPISSPVAVRAGDRVAIRIDTHDGIAVRWQVQVTRAGHTIGRFDHSTLGADTVSMQALRKHAADYRPTLTGLGALERDLLDRFDGTRTTSELESWLTTGSGSIFPSAQEAAAFLKQTIERCG